MKKLLIACVVVAAFTFAYEVNGQTPLSGGTSATPTTQDSSISQFHVIGEVTALDATANQMTIRTDAGNTVVANLVSATTYRRAQPGATNLEGATSIALADIGVGDRVFARGRVATDRRSVPARDVVVMRRADIAARQERDRAEWQRRGAVGTVAALNPATKEITLTVRGQAGQTIIVDASNANVRFRRYAPDSVRFADARQSRFEELRIGDQLRALGERSPDGARLASEEIVSGAFRTLIGTVASVDPQTNEVHINPLGANGAQPFTARLNNDSLVRRIPPEVAAMIAARRSGAEGAGVRGSSSGATPSPSPQNNTMRRPAGETGGAGGAGAQPPRRMGVGGGSGGQMDLRDMLERLPALTLADLRPGALVLVSSTVGADPSRVTALALVSGIEAFVPTTQGSGRQTPGVNPGLPGGVLDIGIGLP